MTKKYQPSYTKAQSSYIHPSLQSSRPSSSSPTAPRSVNERIQQLRREAAPRATAERRDEITDLVTQRTLPPSLRRILNKPEVNAPLPKPGSRDRNVRTARRPPPGPAAPSSWLEDSRHAPRRLGRTKRIPDEDQENVRGFSSLATLDDGSKKLPPTGSLRHQALKKLAKDWIELAVDEQYNIPALPIPLKEALLSHISVYGLPNCLDIRSFKMLFSNDPEIGGTGSEEVQFLDLSHLINTNFSLLDLFKYMSRPQLLNGQPQEVEQAKSVTQSIQDISLSDAKGKQPADEDIAESWEDEVEDAPSLPKIPNLTRFPHLTRLSLAHPGPTASWAHLLTLSSKLSTLTHLSLAYWPPPSVTPNATTASIVAGHSKVALGGTHYYSELDDDYHEAANILRRLSTNLYSLQHLDLEGCTWHKALTWSGNSTPLADIFSRPADGWDDASPSSPEGPDWNNAWSQITYLNLSQGWIPKNQAAIMSMPAGVLAVELLSFLRQYQSADASLGEPRTGVDEWFAREKVAREVDFAIYSARKRGKGAWCRVDHGWVPHGAKIKARRGSDAGDG